MSHLTSRALVVLCSSALLTACGGEDSTTPTTPTPSEPRTATEVFTGQINRNGAFTHPFLAASAGTVEATLDVISPEDVASIGVSLGTWNGSACQTVIANDNAVQGAKVVGAASIASNLCLRVYDVGKIPAVASYQVTVVRPD
jgi:hypothetical protein